MAIVPLPSTPRARVPPRLSRDRRRRYSPIVSLPVLPLVPSRDSSRPVPTLAHGSRHGAAVGRSRGRRGSYRSRAGAVKLSATLVVARARCAPSDDDDDEDGEEDGDERLPPRVARAESFARPEALPASAIRHPRSDVIHPRARARARERRAGHPRSTRRPSSIVRRRRDASREREEKTGARRVPRSLSSRVRSFARARATMWRATTRARRRVSSKSAGPVASLHFFIRARGYRVEACVKSMYVCEWFDTAPKKEKNDADVRFMFSEIGPGRGVLFWGRGGPIDGLVGDS